MNILHLEDNASDANLIYEVLCGEVVDCRITRVDTRQAFLGAMDRDDWDIILADYSLPSFDGISALKMAVEKHPDVPFIFVTGALGEELAVATLKQGATDYILKHRLGRLPQAVARARREGQISKTKKEVEQKLKGSLLEKELLLQEVHHRVKNNLEIVCSLLNMQSVAINDPFLSSALRESQQRIQSMAIVHEMLYASSSLIDIDFAAYTALLVSEVMNSYCVDPNRIRVALELESLRLEIDRAIPCGLILNELLSNVFKYAFPDGRAGEVRISLRQRDCCIRLAVEDTGIGLQGRSLNEIKSLGLDIVNILAKQLRGNLEITSNEGAHFVVTFAQATAATRQQIN